MKIAVLSDIHGNHIALKRCVDYCLSHGITRFAFLGDYVGEFAYPQKTMELLYELNDTYECTFIKGNKEDYWLGFHAGWNIIWRDGDSTTGILLYNYKNLTQKDLDFFDEMPISKTLSIDGYPSITLCHGSPRRNTEELYTHSSTTLELMKEDSSSIIICGHTHKQFLFEHKSKVLANPGSVGCPIGQEGTTQFLTLEAVNDAWHPQLITLTYDTESVLQELNEEKMEIRAPYWTYITKKNLQGEHISHGEVLSQAMNLCKSENGFCNWPDIPEKYWRMALQA